jgi:hypothetical protein
MGVVSVNSHLNSGWRLVVSFNLWLFTCRKAAVSTYWIKGFRSSLDKIIKIKILFMWESESSHPACNQSLYWLAIISHFYITNLMSLGLCDVIAYSKRSFHRLITILKVANLKAGGINTVFIPCCLHTWWDYLKC